MSGRFLKETLVIALPVALQSLLTSAFSVVDQVMIGQLQETAIAGVGFASKFLSIPNVVFAAVAAAASILISQYQGQKRKEAADAAAFQTLVLSLAVAGLFLMAAETVPQIIAGLYTRSGAVQAVSGQYLRILAFGFPFLAYAGIGSAVLRCSGFPRLPLYASAAGLVLNTAGNWLLIFVCGWGVAGAAIASLISQAAVAGIVWMQLARHQLSIHKAKESLWMLVVKIVLPLMATEFLWSLGENVYAGIYGHISTDASAAMTMTIPLQTLCTGFLSGLSAAAGILVGKDLGAGSQQEAVQHSRLLMGCAFAGSVILAAGLWLSAPFYVRLYPVQPAVQQMTVGLIEVFAVFSIVKVQNMVLGGGIIRSGGRTSLLFWIDTIGTWGFGVPLGLLASLVWHLDVVWVYAILSLEECVRLGMSWIVFEKGWWVRRI